MGFFYYNYLVDNLLKEYTPTFFLSTQIKHGFPSVVRTAYKDKLVVAFLVKMKIYCNNVDSINNILMRNLNSNKIVLYMLKKAVKCEKYSDFERIA